MLAEYVTRIQNNPDWIGYGLWMIAVLVLVCIALLIWHRAKSLTRAEVNVAGVTGQVSSLEDKVTEQAQQLADIDRKSTRLNSSHVVISYAVFCLKKKTISI